jgi:hypothetical protein
MKVLAMMFVFAAAVGMIAAPAFAETPAGSLSIPLKGLTKDNAAKAEAALVKLDRNGFRCTTCDYFAKAAGECPGCKTALVVDRAGPLLKDVKIDATKNVVMFGIAGSHGARLSEIEAALTPISIEVDRKLLPITPFTKLTITGVDSEEAAQALEKALEDAKHYESIKTDVNLEHKMAILFVGSAKTHPTLDGITKTIEKAGSFKIAGISWTAVCSECAAKGMKHAGCLSCWETGA